MRAALDASIEFVMALALGGLWLLGVAAPLLVFIAAFTVSGGASLDRLAISPLWTWGRMPALLAMTLGWSLAITLAAAAVGVPLGLCLARTGSGMRSRVWTALAVSILCLPPYLLYWVWGLLRLPGSWVGEWARQSAWRASALQVWQLWWGLTWWSWPLVALVIAAAVRARPRAHDEMLVIDGARWRRRAWMTLSEVRPAVGLGVGLALLSTLTGFVAFDLAASSLPMAETYPSVLRRLRFEVGPDAATIASGPLVAVNMAIAGLLAWCTSRSALEGDEDSSAADRKWSHFALALAAIVSLALPIGIMFERLGGFEPFARLGPLEGRAIGESVSWAVFAGVMFFVIAIGHAFGWSHPRRLVRRVTSISAIGWVIVGVMPAAARGALLVQSHAQITRILPASLYPETLWLALPGGQYITWPVLVIIGYAGSYGVISVLIGWWMAAGEDESLRSARLLDGAVSLRHWLGARGWRVGAAGAIAGLFGLVLSLGDVSTTMIVLPPGAQSLTQRLLNKMHYAYEDSALATCLMIMAIVIPVGFLAALLLGWLRQSTRRHAIVALVACSALLAGLPGCSKPPSLDEGPFEPKLIIGSTGRGPGQFVYPRGMAFDPTRDCLYVVDKTGRVQRFDEEGHFLDAIVLPKFDRGFPTGMSIEPGTGKLFIADTHEHRVLVYDADGRLERTIGSEGQEPGQMLYPTDIAFGPGGLLFVSEYGGNDRVQAFDHHGQVLYSFGEFGFGDGQFNRPQSVEYDAKRDELVILDACNHRVVVTDLKGNWKFTAGGPGRGPGQLNYPYGLVLQDDGSFLISEFGNSRIQHLGRDGQCLGIYGTSGAEPGYLQTPWGLAANGRDLYVVDAHNDRVQVLRRP